MRRTIHPGVINPDLLHRLDVIVDDHFAGSNDRHLAHLAWFQPTALDGGELPALEGQGKVGNILDARRDVGVSLAVDEAGNLTEQMKDDRNIMRSQIPNHVDVLLKQPQIETLAVDVTDVADFSLGNDLADHLNRGGIEKRVAHHQGQTPPGSDLDELQALGRA